MTPRATTYKRRQRDTAAKATEEINCITEQHLVTPTVGRKGGTEKRKQKAKNQDGRLETILKTT